MNPQLITSNHKGSWGLCLCIPTCLVSSCFCSAISSLGMKFTDTLCMPKPSHIMECTEAMLIPISSASYWMVIQWSSITKVLRLSIISSFRLVDDLWECVSLSTNVQTFFKGLYHTLIYLIPTEFSPKACWILPMVFFWIFPSFHKIQCNNIFQVIPSFHKLTNKLLS